MAYKLWIEQRAQIIRKKILFIRHVHVFLIIDFEDKDFIINKKQFSTFYEDAMKTWFLPLDFIFVKGKITDKKTN